MDPTSAVRTDTLPAIATVVAPGAFASSPYAWWFLSAHPDLQVFLNNHEAVMVALAILVWTTMGFVVESVGSYVEVYLIDRRRSDSEQLLRDWWQYLQIAWDREPIGQRYLRRLVVSFKFELNMSVALVLSLPGVAAVTAPWQGAPARGVGLILGLGTAALLLFIAARGSADVLANIRRQLVEADERLLNVPSCNVAIGNKPSIRSHSDAPPE